MLGHQTAQHPRTTRDQHGAVQSGRLTTRTRPYETRHQNTPVPQRRLGFSGVQRPRHCGWHGVRGCVRFEVEQRERAGVLRLRRAHQSPHARGGRVRHGVDGPAGHQDEPGVGEPRLGQPVLYERERPLHGRRAVAARHRGEHERRHRPVEQRVEVRVAGGPGQRVRAEYRPVVRLRRARRLRQWRPVEGEQAVRPPPVAQPFMMLAESLVKTKSEKRVRHGDR